MTLGNDVDDERVNILMCVRSQGFLMKESREILRHLKLIFATIIRFCKAQKNLYTTAMHEKHVEERRQQFIQRQELDVRSREYSVEVHFLDVLMNVCVFVSITLLLHSVRGEYKRKKPTRSEKTAMHLVRTQRSFVRLKKSRTNSASSF